MLCMNYVGLAWFKLIYQAFILAGPFVGDGYYVGVPSDSLNSGVCMVLIPNILDRLYSFWSVFFPGVSFHRVSFFVTGVRACWCSLCNF